MNGILTRPQILIVLSAGIGGAAPNLVDLAQIWTGKDPWIPGLVYYLGLAIFFLVGAFVALIFHETDSRKAFFLGVSLPALIAAAQAHGPGTIPTQPAPTQTQEAPKDPPEPSGSLLQVLPFAQAAEPSPRQDEPAQITHESDGEPSEANLTLKFSKLCANCQLWLFDGAGKILGNQPVPSKFGVYDFVLPLETKSFGVWNGQINPQLWSLPQNQPAWKYEVEPKKDLWNDLWRGLGDYSKKPYDLHVTPFDG